jgi:hypothetical protein
MMRAHYLWLPNIPSDNIRPAIPPLDGRVAGFLGESEVVFPFEAANGRDGNWHVDSYRVRRFWGLTAAEYWSSVEAP